MKNLIGTLVLGLGLVAPGLGNGVARAEKHPTNTCGCYGEGDNCFCDKGAKCGCPGECEPRGCEAERQKKLQKEMDEEIKKAKEQDQARNKPKAAAKPAADDDEDDAPAPAKGGGSNSAKAPVSKAPDSTRAMTAAQKKQLQKLIDAYLAEHPEAKSRSLGDIRGDL